jgi:hypothetical protein
MKHAPPPLERLQQWTQAAVTHPGGVVRGVESFAAANGTAASAIEHVVTRSRAMTAVERLEIYNRAYFARLLECLREEYSALAAALGQDLFDTFAVGYLQECPPGSYTLADLGARFPEYLAATRPTPGSEQGSEADWPEFLVDLARLERAINEVFDGPGVEGRRLLSAERLREIPAERWPDVRLVCVPCLRLMTFGFPVNDCFTAIRASERWDVPRREPSFVAISRRDYRVFRHPLAVKQFELLHGLAMGETIGAIITRLAPERAQDEQFAARLHGWFFDGATAGFFESAKV